MKIKLLTSVMRILGVMMIVSIIPSCAFASENSSSDHVPDMGFGPAGNVTDENFSTVQTSILDSISKQISELQSLYTNVSEASNATELKEILAIHRPENECIGPVGTGRGPVGTGRGPVGMSRGPVGMSRGPAGLNVFNLDRIANLTDDNLIEIRTEIVNSLRNTTEMLNDQLNDTVISQDSNMTEEINTRIAKLQNLSAQVSEASTTAELKEVVFTYMQTQAVDSIEKEIEHLQAQISDSNNTSGNTTELSSKITELTTLKEKISGAESLEDLKGIMSSSHGIFGKKVDMMHHGGYERHGCHLDKPGRMKSYDNIAGNNTDDTTCETD